MHLICSDFITHDDVYISKREENFNKEITIKKTCRIRSWLKTVATTLFFPDLSTESSILVCEYASDTGCKEHSAGSGEDGDVTVIVKSKSCETVL